MISASAPSPLSTATMQKSPLVAIDTNFPLLLVKGDDTALEALNIVLERMHPVEILVPPTVQGELLHQAENDPDRRQRALAQKALLQLRSRWHFHPADLNSAQEPLSARPRGGFCLPGSFPPPKSMTPTSSPNPPC